jgi:hypothetical protein
VHESGLLTYSVGGAVLVRQKHKGTLTIPRHCQALGRCIYRNELRTRYANTCTGAGTVKFTSRILEGLMARRGFVEPREGIGLPFLYWVVEEAVEVAVEEEE